MTKKKQDKMIYVIGSIVILGITSVIIPKVTKNVVNSIYKMDIKKKNKNSEDDCKPEIVKKSQ